MHSSTIMTMLVGGALIHIMACSPGCGICRLSAQALIPRSKNMDHHERGYLAEEWTIVRWYDMPQITRGRGPPRRRAIIRNVMTEETREIPLTRCMACGYWSVHWCPCFRCGFPFCTRESCSTRDTFRATNWRNRMWGSVTLCTHCHALLETGRADRNAAAVDAYLNTRVRRRYGL